MNRRQVLASATTTTMVGTAGCLDGILGFGNSQETIELEEPGDEPAGTPGEFYYLLDDIEIAVDELYHNTDDNDLLLFYESDAESMDDSDSEVWLIFLAFSELISHGMNIDSLYTEVVDRFDEQVEGWAVNSEWVEEYETGEINELVLWNGIVSTMVYPDDDIRPAAGDQTDVEEGADFDDGGETESPNETMDDGDADES